MSSIVAHARGFLMGLGTHALLARAFISPTQFSKPADLAECLRRVRYNLSHFRYHYGMIYVFVLVWTILSSPQLLIGLLVLAAAWMYCFVLTNHYDAMAVTTRAVAVMAVAVMPVAVAVKAVTVTPVDTAVMALALAIGCFELSVQVYVVLVLVPYSIFIVTLPGMFNSLVFAVILSTLIALPHASFHATPCKYFAKGYCKLGAQCRFVHDESAAQQDGGRRRGGGGGGKGQMGQPYHGNRRLKYAAGVAHCACQIEPGAHFARHELTPQRSFDPKNVLDAHFRLCESHVLRQLGHASKRLVKVEYVVNPPLIRQFEQQLEDFERAHIPANMVLAFHATRERASVDNIIQHNFDPRRIGSQTDSGWWGRGFYFSEYPATSLGYGSNMLLCRVLPGKTYDVTQRMDGQPLRTGFNSHRLQADANGYGQELVIDNPKQILPCYILHFQ
jgi:hypothetical protein